VYYVGCEDASASDIPDAKFVPVSKFVMQALEAFAQTLPVCAMPPLVEGLTAMLSLSTCPQYLADLISKEPSQALVAFIAVEVCSTAVSQKAAIRFFEAYLHRFPTPERTINERFRGKYNSYASIVYACLDQKYTLAAYLASVPQTDVNVLFGDKPLFCYLCYTWKNLLRDYAATHHEKTKVGGKNKRAALKRLLLTLMRRPDLDLGARGSTPICYPAEKMTGPQIFATTISFSFSSSSSSFETNRTEVSHEEALEALCQSMGITTRTLEFMRSLPRALHL
jgi:hypothetical protein